MRKNAKPEVIITNDNDLHSNEKGFCLKQKKMHLLQYLTLGWYKIYNLVDYR